MEKKTHRGFWIFFLSLLSFFFSVAPLATVFLINFDKYTKTVGASVKLGIGGVLAVVFLLLKVLGKLKVPSRVAFYAFMFLGSWLFEAVLADMVLLSGAALLGEGVDSLIVQPILEKMKKQKQTEDAADVTADKVRQVLEDYIGGRV